MDTFSKAHENTNAPMHAQRKSISKSKQPEDFNPVDFLQNCNVALYEDNVFKETLPYILKDTLSGLGYYTSSFKLSQNKTYKIISAHPELGTAEAEEYLPPYPKMGALLLLHADSAHPYISGKFAMLFEDSAGWKNYYYIDAFYRVLKPVVNDLGDTTYKTDYIFNVPAISSEIPNPSHYPRSYFTDETLDGQPRVLSFDFPSQYNDVYKEITLIVELSNTGKNFYDWNIQQIPFTVNNLNDGQQERTNLKNNIINGYGHFTANSSSYYGFPIK